MKLNAATLAVIGADTQTGRDILGTLAERGVPKTHVTALNVGRSATTDSVSYGEEETLALKGTDGFDFSAVKAVFFIGEPREAAPLAKIVTASGAVFLDLSGIFALDPDVPLVVTGVNEAVLEQPLRKKIVALPHPLSVFAALALAPLHTHAGVTRAVISTYSGVSHWGRPAQDELFSQTKAMFMAQETTPQHLPKTIAFSCYPMLGHPREDNVTDIEWQVMAQVKKIVDTKIKIAVNTVTVPVFIGDGMMINVETREEISPIKAALWLTGQKHVGVVEDDEILPTHSDITQEDFLYVARLRDDISVENGIAFWAIGDTQRLGIAVNAVDVLQALLKNS